MTNEQINKIVTLPVVDNGTYIMYHYFPISRCFINKNLNDFDENVQIRVDGRTILAYRVVQRFENIVDIQYFDNKLKLVDRIVKVYA